MVLAGIVGAGIIASPARADSVRDFNGDGRGDLTALFDDGNGSTGLWVFPGATPGPLPLTIQPYEAWETPPGIFWPSAAKTVGGDFTGDGRKDIMALYDYGGGSAGLWIIPGVTGSGPTATGMYRVWLVPRGNFWVSEMKIAAGDFNGDGKDDLLALYNFGSSAGLFVFPGTAAAGDGVTGPYLAWESRDFRQPDMDVAGGDFNGDGKDDLIAIYDFSGGAAGLFVFPGSASGVTAPQRVWYTTGPFEPTINRRAQLTATDRNSDGKDDVYLLTGGNLLGWFPGTDQVGDRATGLYVFDVSQFPDTYTLSKSRITSGAFYGGGGQLMGMYDVGDGRTAMWTLEIMFINNIFQPYLSPVWVSNAGDFPMNRMYVTP
jgi:hypothetical protein